MPLHFNEINRFSAKKAILGPKVHFLAPNATSRTPCAKPFINTSSWEVFWRPRAGKVRFGPEKLEISLQNRVFVKKAFFAQKCKFREKVGEFTKCYFFCFKKISKIITFVICFDICPPMAKINEIPLNFRKFLEI